jgi:transposase, IS30 family
MARFVNGQVPEVVQPFWDALQRGEFIADAAVAAGTYRKQGTRWVAACGGVRPRRGRDLEGRCLTFSEREEIALARARGETIRATPGAWAARRRRSRESCAATPTATVAA